MLWEHKFNVFHTDIVADRLGWTNVVGDPETDNGVRPWHAGAAVLLRPDGKVLWQHSLTEEYGRVSGYGGRLTSPIVDGDLLIISMLNASWGYNGTGRTRLVAFDKRTGKVVWWGSTGFPPKDSYYSNPVVAVINGERLVVTGGGDGGVHAFKVRTGEKVWSYIYGTGAINCSPVIAGDLVYIGHGDTNAVGDLQGKVVCLDGSKVTAGQPKLVWEVEGIKVKFASPILAGDRLYVCNDLGALYCLDAKTGAQHWKFRYGKNTKGSPVLADGKIYIGEEDGKFHILKPEDKKCTRLHVESFVGEVINGSPSVANGRVLFMTTEQMFCLGLKEPGPAAPIPAAVQEPPAARGAAVSHVAVFPADLVLHPGEAAELKAFGFDDHGRALGEIKVDWSLAARGFPKACRRRRRARRGRRAQGHAQRHDRIGDHEAGRGAGPAAGAVRTRGGDDSRHQGRRRGTGARGGEAALQGRLQQDPRGRTPGGWVNTQGKFAVAKLPDGSFALKKLAVIPSPLVARANAYIGMPDLTNYTIQADIMGTQVGEDLPDAGIGANRYTLMFAGNDKVLRLVSWDALPRIETNVVFNFKPGVWYRLKLTVDVEGQAALVRGKVWPADQEEPKKWTLEVRDPVGNKEGAPTLYANATGIEGSRTGTETFFKNVSVMPNTGSRK